MNICDGSFDCANTKLFQPCKQSCPGLSRLSNRVLLTRKTVRKIIRMEGLGWFLPSRDEPLTLKSGAKLFQLASAENYRHWGIYGYTNGEDLIPYIALCDRKNYPKNYPVG